MKLLILTSAASILLESVPGILSLTENRLRGSSSAVAKSIASFRDVLDAASAVVGGVHDEDECWDYEETKDHQRTANTWCFRAHQQCCSSENKYAHSHDFCVFYGFEPEPDETSDGIDFNTDDPEDPVDCTMCGDTTCDGDDSERDDRNSRGECYYYEEDRDYEKEEDTWCFHAHQECCSSENKYNKWLNFCEYYGFEDPGDHPEGIAGYIPWTFNTVDCTMCDDEKCDQDDTKLVVKSTKNQSDDVDISNDEDWSLMYFKTFSPLCKLMNSNMKISAYMKRKLRVNCRV
ncbi:hypothetical protein ACHAW5_007678 [Stephanodiscus triporus]|uniref:Secreted protein n=1 Tax=Stephanodiscus triporus TaxID=2934178 RepID=A0ABD3NMF1_9STRA